MEAAAGQQAMRGNAQRHAAAGTANAHGARGSSNRKQKPVLIDKQGPLSADPESGESKAPRSTPRRGSVEGEVDEKQAESDGLLECGTSSSVVVVVGVLGLLAEKRRAGWR